MSLCQAQTPVVLLSTTLRSSVRTSVQTLHIPVKVFNYRSPFNSSSVQFGAQRRPAALAVNADLIWTFAKSYLRTVFGGKPGPMAAPGQAWWSKDTVAVVTGGNKGIGYEITRQLAKAGISTVLTARNSSLGEEAQKQLKGEGLEVAFHKCDISDPASIDALAKWIESKYGGIDILVNNAGFAYKGDFFGPDEAKTTIGVNYTGTKNMCERLLPLLKPSKAGARIVNVCSSAGKLGIVNSPLREQFADPNLSKEQLDKLMEKFPEDVAKGRHKEEGWPNSMYGVSKLGEATYTRILARDLASRPEGQRILVNACCPGYVKTDMSSQRGYKTPEQGADTPVWLALLPPDGPSGRWWIDRTDKGF